MSYHSRYLNGDRDRVWHELRGLGSAVRGPELIDDVGAVAREAMTRARWNIETLIERLRAQGYRFGDPHNDDGASQPHAPPSDGTPTFVALLEQRLGPLPMTARMWIEVVGDVNLLGVHPRWPSDIVADPLVVEFEYKSWKWAQQDHDAARTHYETEYEAWSDSRSDDGLDIGPFVLDVAPDALHKANISGGSPYGVLVPDGSADATFRFDDGVLLPFIEYLNLAFRWGGFPGFWKRDHGPAVFASLGELKDGLLDL